MLDLTHYLQEIDEKEDNLLQMVHIKYKFIQLYDELEKRIINERGQLTRKEKEEQFYETETLYNESLDLLTLYKNKKVEEYRKRLLEDE